MYTNKRKTAVTLLIVIAVIAALGALYVLMSHLETALSKAPENAGTAPTLTTLEYEDEVIPLIEYNGRTYRYNTDLTTLLILGIDDREVTESQTNRNTSQADFLLLAIFDPAEKSVKLLQLNRDTMTNIPVLDSFGQLYGLTFQQLALAHTYGSGLEDSCENTAYAVSLLLYDLPVEKYLSFTMDAIPVINDLVGGVTVTIEDNFNGVDDSLVLGSTVTLTGTQAETFVRARRSMPDDPTNIARMRRQRVYLDALTAAIKARSASDPGFVADAYAAVEEYLVTNCSADELLSYASLFDDYTLTDILTPEGETDRGGEFMEFYVDEAALREQIIDLFYLPYDG